MNRIVHPRKTAGRPWMTILATVFACMVALSYIGASHAATLLPLAETTFLDNNGNPLSGGSVYFYVPNTTTPKDTWQDAAGMILNTNPVILDAGGRALIYGNGSYRQIVKDSLGNTIWDQVTADTAATTGITWGGTSSGTANAQTVVATGFSNTAGAKLLFIAGVTNTGAMTVNPNGSGPITVLKPSLSGSVALTGGEVSAGNLVELDSDGTNLNIIDGVSTPIGGTQTNISSNTTTDIGTIASHNANITGVTTITSFGSSANLAFPIYFIKFAGSLTLTYNASTLVIPGGQSIVTSAGDTGIVEYLGAGVWRVRQYTYANPPHATEPQGRLTLISGSPVMTTDTTAATSIYYDPYVGNEVNIWNGATFTPTTFTEQTLTLTSSQLANTNYDVFDTLNSGALFICVGPAWTSGTARGTGATTTELERQGGLWVNKNSMSCLNGATSITVAVDSGTYLGTFRTTGSTGTTTWVANPAAAAGGGNSQLYLFNAYNRVQVSASSKDSTDTWNYTTATWHPADSGATGSGLNNRVSAVFGLSEDADYATYYGFAGNGANGTPFAVGVGVDSTSAWSGTPGYQSNGAAGVANVIQMAGVYNGIPGLGLHFFQALEWSTATNTTTWIGDNGVPLNAQMAISFQGRM